MKKYEPLTLELVDEGRFLDQADADLNELQRKLLAFVAQHGPEANKAKGKLTIEITLSVDNQADQLFGIKAQSKLSLPARPASVTMAIADETQDGQPSLFVRNLGSDRTTPRQGKLCTDDGKPNPDLVGGGKKK